MEAATLVKLIVIVGLFLVIAGCANKAPATTATRLYQAKASYAVALQTIGQLADAGKITPAQAGKLAEAIRHADALFKIAEVAEENGGDTSGWLDRIDAVLAELATQTK